MPLAFFGSLRLQNRALLRGDACSVPLVVFLRAPEMEVCGFQSLDMNTGLCLEIPSSHKGIYLGRFGSPQNTSLPHRLALLTKRLDQVPWISPPGLSLILSVNPCARAAQYA